MKSLYRRLTLTVSALAFLAGLPASVALATCLDGVRLGLFTDRHFRELEAPTRSKVNDGRVLQAARRALRGTRADIVQVDGETKDDALVTASEQGLAVLAYFETDVESREIAMPFGKAELVDILSVSTLQLLASRDGEVLGEGSDIGKSPGLDIEQALDDLLGDSLESVGDKAAREACAKGLPNSAVATAAAAPSSSKASASPATAADSVLVSKTQYQLIASGYDPGTPDGMMGAKTRHAISEAERSLEMPITGRPSTALLDGLRDQREALVFNVQKALKAAGRLRGEPSGILDKATSQAIRQAELEFGLKPDARPDNDLLRLLEANAGAPSSDVDTIDAAANPGLRYRIEQLLVQLDLLRTVPTGEETFDSEEAIRQAELKFGVTPVDGLPDVQLFRVLQAKVEGR